MNYSPGRDNHGNSPLEPDLRVASDEFGYPREEFGLDLKAIVLAVWRRKGLIVLTVALMSAVAFWVADGIEQRYSASARVLFEPERLQIIDYDNVLIRADPTGAGLQNQIEILRSVELMERVVERLELTALPEFNPTLATLNELESAEDADNAAVSDVAQTAPALDQETAVQIDDTATAISALWQHLSLRPVSESRVIEITYSSLDPALAAEIANTIAAEYIALQAEQKRNEILAASKALAGRVEELERQLDAAEDAARVARTESVGTAAIGNRLEAIKQALTQNRLDRTELELSYRRAVDSVDDESRYSIIPVFRESPVLNDYRDRERELQEELVSLSTTARGTDPQIRQLNARIEEMRSNIKLEARNIVESLSLQLEIARENESSLTEELLVLEAEARSQSAMEQRLGRLERDAQSSRIVYETFRNRLKEAREQANLQTSDATILTQALVPVSSDSESRYKIAIIIGLFGGTVLALGAVFILETFNDSYRSPEEVEQSVGLPVLAAIPTKRGARSPRRIADYVLRKPNSALAESVRNLRTSILLSKARARSAQSDPISARLPAGRLSNTPTMVLGKNPRDQVQSEKSARVVMMASSVPGEAKTSTSLLLAQSTRQIGQSSIVVDCDIRRQGRWDIATRKSMPGLVSILEGKANLDNTIRQDPKSGAHFLASGRPGELTKNPADYLSSPEFADLITTLRGRYDLVLLDTPPALVVTDARIVAGLADSVVYMIHWNKTSRNAVGYGLKQLRSAEAKVDGCVLTMVRESLASNMVRSNFLYKRKYRDYISS